MTITLEKLRPNFLDEDSVARSEIWGQDLDWRPGEKVRVTAPSGKGKTLLTQMLYGLRRDYGGAVRFFGEEVRRLREKSLSAMRRARVSIVFQDMRLFEHLSAFDNIDVKASLTGPIDRAQLEDQAGRLGVDKALHRPCSTLSLGEQQRVAIVRALAQPFEWILLDEPFSHLDEESAKAAGELIEEACAERGAGFMLTSLGGTNNLSFDREFML